MHGNPVKQAVRPFRAEWLKFWVAHTESCCQEDLAQPGEEKEEEQERLNRLAAEGAASEEVRPPPAMYSKYSSPCSAETDLT